MNPAEHRDLRSIGQSKHPGAFGASSVMIAGGGSFAVGM
jgi:hypothetical protein